MTSTLVSYELADSVATITMNDGKANVMTEAMSLALRAAFDRAEADHAVVLLTGRERIFSGGYDLATFQSTHEAIVAMLRAGGQLAERIAGFPYPVVAACGGHAMAQGAFLLLACDVRIGAAGDFKIGLNEVAIGLTIPHYGVELARMRLASPYFHHSTLTAAIYRPEQACQAGFLDEVVPPAELLPRARAEAARLGKLNMTAHAGTKQRVRGPALERIRAGLASEFGG